MLNKKNYLYFGTFKLLCVLHNDTHSITHIPTRAQMSSYFSSLIKRTREARRSPLAFRYWIMEKPSRQRDSRLILIFHVKRIDFIFTKFPTRSNCITSSLFTSREIERKIILISRTEIQSFRVSYANFQFHLVNSRTSVD